MTNNQDTITKQISNSKFQKPSPPTPLLLLVIWSLVIVWSLGFVHWSFAEAQYLRDVPEGHYAYEAVYDLIQKGITKGYPDGTFRGKQLVSRYELASFLSKLLAAVERERGKNEKLVEEFKAEVSLLRYEQTQSQKETKISGEFQFLGRKSSLGGGRIDPRLKLVLAKNFAETTSLKMTLDTMDSGSGVARDLVKELLDIEGKIKLGNSALKITSGPGDVTHFDSLFPWENQMKYIRPRRTISLATDFEKTNVSLSYLSRSAKASGVVEVGEVNFKVVYRYPLLDFVFNPRYFYTQAGLRDLTLELGLASKLGEFLLGIAKSTDFPHALRLKGELNLAKEVKIVAQKIGSQYREVISYSLFDLFNRNLADGSTSLGVVLEKNWGDFWLVKVRGDYTNPGEVFTLETSGGLKLGESSAVELLYQAYRAETFSWAVGVRACLGLDNRL